MQGEPEKNVLVCASDSTFQSNLIAVIMDWTCTWFLPTEKPFFNVWDLLVNTLICVLQDDVLTHLYTLIVKSDNTYEVRIDNKKEESGKLEDDWDFLVPKKIQVCAVVVICTT